MTLPPNRFMYYLRQVKEEDTWELVRRMWDIDNFPIPIPKFLVQCIGCHDHHPILRAVSFHIRENSSILYRADVGFKCTNCSLAWAYGVPITDRMRHLVCEMHGVDHDHPRIIFDRRRILSILSGFDIDEFRASTPS